ncbi:MAG: hypothetical protein WCC03_22425 [Candidatus Acidiferrales bacterium]
MAVDPEPATVKLLFTLAPALVEIITCIVIGLALAPGANGVLIVHISVVGLHVHPVPVIPIEPRESDESSVAIALMVPLVAAFPVFDTVIV